MCATAPLFARQQVVDTPGLGKSAPCRPCTCGASLIAPRIAELTQQHPQEQGQQYLEAVFAERRIPVLPDILANAGGVTVS